jgi:hypothetical protein
MAVRYLHWRTVADALCLLNLTAISPFLGGIRASTNCVWACHRGALEAVAMQQFLTYPHNQDLTELS